MLEKYFNSREFAGFQRIEGREYIILKTYSGYKIIDDKGVVKAYEGTKKEIEKRLTQIRMDIRDARIEKKRKSLENRGIETRETGTTMKKIIEAYQESKI